MRLAAVLVAASLCLVSVLAQPLVPIKFCHVNGLGAHMLVTMRIQLWNNVTTFYSPPFGYMACVDVTIDFVGYPDTRTTLYAYSGDEFLYGIYFSPSTTDTEANAVFLTQKSDGTQTLQWDIRYPRLSIDLPNGYAWIFFLNYATNSDTAIDFTYDTSGGVSQAAVRNLAYRDLRALNVTLFAFFPTTWNVRPTGQLTAAPLAAMSNADGQAIVPSNSVTYMVFSGNKNAAGQANYDLLMLNIPLAASSLNVSLCAFNSEDDAAATMAGTYANAATAFSVSVPYRLCQTVSAVYPVGLFTRTLGISLVSGTTLVSPTTIYLAPSRTDVSRNVVVGMSGKSLSPIEDWILVTPAMPGNYEIADGQVRFVVLNAGIGVASADFSAGEPLNFSPASVLFSEHTGQDTTSSSVTATVVVTAKASDDQRTLATGTFAANLFKSQTLLVGVLSGSASEGYTVGPAGSDPSFSTTTSAVSLGAVPSLMLVAACVLTALTGGLAA